MATGLSNLPGSVSYRGIPNNFAFWLEELAKKADAINGVRLARATERYVERAQRSTLSSPDGAVLMAMEGTALKYEVTWLEKEAARGEELKSARERRAALSARMKSRMSSTLEVEMLGITPWPALQQAILKQRILDFERARSDEPGGPDKP